MKSLVAALIAGLALAAHAERPLRVAVTGDYPPLCERDAAGGYLGFDPDVARAFAAERGYAIAWVPVTWPALPEALAAGSFDVAMTGVTVRPERSVAGRFSVPVLESGAVVLVRERALASLEALSAPGIALGVNAGGHLERVARARFPLAAIKALPDNSAVGAALASGGVPAVITDTLEAPRWQAAAPGAVPIGPLTRDAKAYWLPADRAELATELDAWLLARETDGTLDRLRSRWLGTDGVARRPALPTLALVAAIAERLALMPAVAEAKRATGAPLLDAERETALLAAALSAVQVAGKRDALAVPDSAALEQFFGALFAASRSVQSAVLAAPAAPAPPDWRLEEELRPALSRVTERIAALLPRLPLRLSEPALANELAALSGELPGFGADAQAALAAALSEVASAPRARLP